MRDLSNLKHELLLRLNQLNVSVQRAHSEIKFHKQGADLLDEVRVVKKLSIHEVL